MSSSSEPLHFSQEDMAAYKVQMTELEREQFEKLWPRMQQRVLLRMLRLDDPATPYRRSRPLPRPLPPLPPRYRPNNAVGLVYLWISAIFSFFVFAIVTLRRPPSPFRPSRPPTSQYADRISEGVYGDEGMARRPGGAPPDSSRTREVLRSGILEYPRPRRQSSSSSRNEAIAASRMVAVADIRQAPPQNLIEDCAGRTWRAEGCGGGLQEEHQSSSTLFPQESRSRNVSPESWNSNNPYRPRFVDDEDNNDNDKNRDDYHQEDMVARWPVLDHERFQRALDATEEQPVLDHFILNRFLADEITPRAPVIDVSPSLSDSSG